MNFLALCQRVAQESGTIDGPGQPASVTGQTGRLAKVVNWTATAWEEIQNLNRGSWRFLEEEFSGKLTSPNVARYSASTWNLTDFANWITDKERVDYCPFRLYRQSDGVAGQGTLRQISWSEWQRTYNIGVQRPGPPSVYAISPKNELCLGPVPDGIYVIAGEYRKHQPLLAANGDTPWAPAHHHMTIVWKAVQLLAQHDEGVFTVGASKAEYTKTMDAMVATELPAVEIFSDPIA